MKIAIVALNDYSKVKGGTEVFVQHLRETFPGSNTISAPVKTNRLVEKLGVQDEYRSWRVSKELGSYEYDVLIRNGYAGWSIKTTKPVINVFHFTYKGFSQEAMIRNMQSKIIAPFFEKLCMDGTIVAVSQKVKRELMRYYHRESQVIENAVPDIFHKIPQEKAREHICLDCDEPMGIFVGRADETKGFDIVRKVAKNIKIMCVTPSDIKNEENMIVRNNIDYNEMPWYYAASDFLIFPSRYESSGYSVMEALKCGIPVIASKTGVLEDVCSEQVGAIVNIGDEEGFIRGVNQVMKHGFVLSSEIIERYSMKRFQKEYNELLNSVVG